MGIVREGAASIASVYIRSLISFGKRVEVAIFKRWRDR